FPNHHPDPSQPKNLADLIARLRQGDCELGSAFDGDGDRLGVVTRAGHIIYPDRQLMLFAADVLSRVPGATIIYDVKSTRNLGPGGARQGLCRVPGATIIYDVKSTRNLGPWVARHGGTPLLWKTGHSLIKTKMK